MDMAKWNQDRMNEAIQIFEQRFKDKKINDLEELVELIGDLMIEFGPDGHLDGHEIIATIVWKLLK